MNFQFLSFVIVCILLKGIPAMAGKETGGGDICEDRIKEIRGDLSSWIVSAGPSNLKFDRPMTAEEYSAKMLTGILKTKIKCVGEGDPGFPVEINGTPKVCRFDRSDEKSSVTCDYKKFNATSESHQYILVHHEFAGIANVEIPNGEDSTYRLSNQISAFLSNQLVKRLSIKPHSPIPADGCLPFYQSSLQKDICRISGGCEFDE